MEIDSSLIMQYGLMSKLSTGYALVDALLVMLVPLLVNRLLPQLRTFFEELFHRSAPAEQTYERSISHKQSPNHSWWCYSDDDHPNHKLQQAIIVYLNTLPDLFSQLESCEVRLCKAKRQPAAAADSEEKSNSACSDDCSSSCSSDDDWYPGMELEKYEVKMVPPLDTWIDVEPGLSFKRSEGREGSEKDAQLVTTYVLVGKTAAQVEEWIAKAYDAYRLMLKGEQAASKADRYLYLPVLHGSNDDGEHITYRRYKLSDDKTFENLFHADKEELLKLVDSFMNKQGKFAIKGYPHKLGFLLHGPPGTGKTSFIKALASHTKRSIINIPLSCIKTNQQLMDMMFDQRVQVEGEDMRVPLPFDKTIFVMEDVDAASHVVQKRESRDSLAATMAALMGTGATGNSCVAKGATSSVSAAKVESDKHTSSDDSEADTASAEAAAVVAGPAPAPGKASPATAAWLAGVCGIGGMSGTAGGDALNLAGLLNVLDGVVDTPGRLIVMSTNHPEQLDPALIRPGRINKKVYMGHLAAAEALAMIRHYFGDLTHQQQTQLLGSWVDGTVSPATLEALCAEHENVEGLLSAAQQLVATVAGASRQPDKQQRLQQQAKVAAATTAACCEGSSGAAGSCIIIRASSCTASFPATAGPAFEGVS